MTFFLIVTKFVVGAIEVWVHNNRIACGRYADAWSILLALDYYNLDTYDIVQKCISNTQLKYLQYSQKLLISWHKVAMLRTPIKQQHTKKVLKWFICCNVFDSTTFCSDSATIVWKHRRRIEYCGNERSAREFKMCVCVCVRMKA